MGDYYDENYPHVKTPAHASTTTVARDYVRGAFLKAHEPVQMLYVRIRFYHAILGKDNVQDRLEINSSRSLSFW